MAIGIQQLNAKSAPDSNFLSGKIIDETSAGAADGTQINAAQHNQFWQFFDQLMRGAGLTFNGLPENETNGYQLITALQDRFKYDNVSSVRVIDSASDVQQTLISGTYYYMELKKTCLEVDLPGSVSDNIVSFGNTDIKGIPYHYYEHSGSGALTITLNSTNAGAYPPIKKQGITANNSSFTFLQDRIYQLIRLDTHWQITEL